MALIQLTSNMTSSELRETQNSNNVGFNSAITSLQTSVLDKSGILIRSVSGVTATAYDAVTEKPAQLTLYGNTIQPTLPNQYSDATAITNVTSPVALKVTGKNMITYPYAESSKTANNVTFTVNSDSTIAVSTTAAGASATTTLNLTNYTTPPVFPAGTYTVSGCPAGGTLDKYYISVQSKVGTTYSTLVRDFGAGATFTLSTATALSISLPIKISTIITTPITFSPMLCLSAGPSTAYAAYSGAAYSVALTDTQASPVTHELCRLTDGTNVWADYIEKQNGVWKITKCVGKVVLTGSETVTLPETPAASGYFRFNVALSVVPAASQLNATSGSKCTHFIQGDSITTPSFKFTTIGASSCIATFCVKDTTLTANTVGGVTVWLQHQNVDLSAPVTVYYPLATPVTYTLATATQTVLNGVYAKTGTTNIWCAAYPGISSIKAALYVDNYQSLALRELMSIFHPIGSIYMSVDSTNPGGLFGGTWVAWGAGRVPVGVDATQTEFDTVEETGGAKTHTLSVAEMPSHTHGVYYKNIGGSGSSSIIGNSGSNDGNVLTSSAGSGTAHNNLQPYVTCYMWKRTA